MSARSHALLVGAAALVAACDAGAIPRPRRRCRLTARATRVRAPSPGGAAPAAARRTPPSRHRHGPGRGRHPRDHGPPARPDGGRPRDHRSRARARCAAPAGVRNAATAARRVRPDRRPGRCGREKPGARTAAGSRTSGETARDAFYGVELPAGRGRGRARRCRPRSCWRTSRPTRRPRAHRSRSSPLGPWTNLADAAALDPAFAGNLAGIHAMGGTIDAPGNIEVGGTTPGRRRRVEPGRRPRRGRRRAGARRPGHLRPARRDQRRPGPGRHRRPARARPRRRRRRHRLRDVRPQPVPRRPPATTTGTR